MELNEVSELGATPIGLVSLEEKEMTQKTQRDDHVRTHKEGHLEAKEGRLQRNQMSQDLHQIVSLQNCEEVTSCYLMPVCGILLQQP